MIQGLELAPEYHRNLPARIRQYLKQARGLSDEVIDRHLLGWNGSRITIPIFDREGCFAFFKLAKHPDDKSESPKMLATSGAHAELYGWECVLVRPEQIIICEGEFDRLVLESRGFAAVTSTGGASTFRPEWALAFPEIPQVYLCFDNDVAGRMGAERVARMIPHALIVSLPKEVGEGGDVTDFFVRLHKHRDEFKRLLEQASPLSEERRNAISAPKETIVRARDNSEVEELKSNVAIEDMIARYITLRVSGQNYSARCPFHEDRTPSFVVYPRTQTFYCFGCHEHGDVLTFLMRADHISFPEALNALRELTNQ